MTDNKYGLSFMGDENVLKFIMMMGPQLSEFTKKQ